MKKHIIFIALFLIQLPLTARADVNPLKSLKNVGDKAYNTTVAPQPIEVVVGNMVKIILSFVGIIFMILIIAGGIQWMTSGGNEQAIETAKKRIVNAVIALVIITVAYALAYWITEAIQYSVTTPAVEVAP